MRFSPYGYSCPKCTYCHNLVAGLCTNLAVSVQEFYPNGQCENSKIVIPTDMMTLLYLLGCRLEGMRMILAQLEHDGQIGSPFRVDVSAAGPAFAALLPALIVPTAVAVFICMSYPARPLVQGLSMGLKAGWGCTLVLRELLEGKEPIAVTFLWSFVGIGITAGVWAVINAETVKEVRMAPTVAFCKVVQDSCAAFPRTVN